MMLVVSQPIAQRENKTETIGSLRLSVVLIAFAERRAIHKIANITTRRQNYLKNNKNE